MAMAVEETLGEYLTEGIISVKILEESDSFKRTRVYVADIQRQMRKACVHHLKYLS